MKTFYENLPLICPQLTICKEKSCLKYHPRCFTGICINYLNSNCKENNCKLNHLGLDKCKKIFKKREINGVYRINICPEINCKQPEKCCYLHMEWIIDSKICVQNLQKKDCKQTPCQLKHLKWKELQEEVQRKYEQDGFCPSQLCLKTGCPPNCKRHLANLKGFCVANFQGICESKGKCLQVHCDWEVSKNMKSSEFIKEQVQPCCIETKTTKTTQNVEIQEKFMALFKKEDMKKIQNELQEQNVVDLLLIMDLTGSMQEWMDSVKNNLLIIIDKFKTIIKNVQIRIAFVGYRDFCDGDKHIVFHEFTPEVSKIKAFIESQEADGGGDAAEDVAGGLEKALSLNFSKHPDSILCTFLFCDAPTHGKQYHDLEKLNTDDLDETDILDEKMNSIEQGSLEKIMMDFKKIKRNNFFSCCKITQHTDIMFGVMQNNFQGLIISEFSSQELTDHIAFTLVHSYQQSQKNMQVDQQKIKISATYLRHKLIKPKFWIKTINDTPVDHAQNFLHQLGCNAIGGETILEIDLNPIPLKNEEKGTCSEIFRIFDIRNNRKLIAKIPRGIYQKMKDAYKENPNGNQKISESDKRESKDEAYNRYYSALIAQQFAVGYREKLRKNEDAPPIFYVSPIIYTLHKQFYGMEFLYAESEIDLPELDWKKITNNAGTLTVGQEAYGAFSHLTFDKSNKRLMITDLQGKGGIFSDPAIHRKSMADDGNNGKCMTENNEENEEENVETQSDANEAKKQSTNPKYYPFLLICSTDHGFKGIQNFFINQHPNCNELCQELNLDRKLVSNVEEKKTNGYDKIEKIQRAIVNCICDICGNQYKMEYNDYKNQEKNEYFCKECSISTEREDVCECCGEKFLHHHERTMRIGQVPTLCDKCDECKESKDKCFYCETKCKQKEFFEIDMSGMKKKICQKAQEYFEQIQCLGCSKSFERKQWPSKKEYMSNRYYCQPCQSKLKK